MFRFKFPGFWATTLFVCCIGCAAQPFELVHRSGQKPQWATSRSDPEAFVGVSGKIPTDMGGDRSLEPDAFQSAEAAAINSIVSFLGVKVSSFTGNKQTLYGKASVEVITRSQGTHRLSLDRRQYQTYSETYGNGEVEYQIAYVRIPFDKNEFEIQAKTALRQALTEIKDRDAKADLAIANGRLDLATNQWIHILDLSLILDDYPLVKTSREWQELSQAKRSVQEKSQYVMGNFTIDARKARVSNRGGDATLLITYKDREGTEHPAGFLQYVIHCPEVSFKGTTSITGALSFAFHPTSHMVPGSIVTCNLAVEIPDQSLKVIKAEAPFSISIFNWKQAVAIGIRTRRENLPELLAEMSELENRVGSLAGDSGFMVVKDKFDDGDVVGIINVDLRVENLLVLETIVQFEGTYFITLNINGSPLVTCKQGFSQYGSNVVIATRKSITGLMESECSEKISNALRKL